MIRSGLQASRDQQGGIALHAALLVMVLVGATIGLVTQTTQRLPRETVTESMRAEALAAADGGIELARAKLARQVDFAHAETTIGQCTVTVTVEPLGASRWRVISIARRLPNGASGLPVKRSVECELSGGGRLPAVRAWRAR